MAEEVTEQRTRRGARGGEAEATTALQTERGSTTIADLVVTKVAAMATREVAGVHDLGAVAARALGAVTERVGVGVADERTRGVSVEVGEREAAGRPEIVSAYGGRSRGLAGGRERDPANRGHHGAIGNRGKHRRQTTSTSETGRGARVT